MDEILTVTDVAGRLKIAERTVYAMLAEGEIPGFKIRGQWRLRASDFYAWLDQVSRGQAREPVAEKPKVGTAVPQDTQQESTAASRLTVVGIHRRFLEAFGSSVLQHSDLSVKPLEIDLAPPYPDRVRLYIFNATSPAGGRPLGEHKIQLILPDQRRGDRGNFDHSDGRMAILAGYSPEDDVFILWDAGLYENFAWSRNVQVKAKTITDAATGSVAEQTRLLRPKGGDPTRETVLVADPQRLPAALVRRVDLTLQRLQE